MRSAADSAADYLTRNNKDLEITLTTVRELLLANTDMTAMEIAQRMQCHRRSCLAHQSRFHNSKL